MPATAGRVRMPANNRVHSSAALQTHGIWQSAIGYDPYAPAADKSKGSKPDMDPGNAYASFRDLLTLARFTNTSTNETRGACKKCGRVGHLTFQCRNFLILKDDRPVAAAAAAAENDDSTLKTAKAIFEKIKKKDEIESEDDDDEDDEISSSDSDVDPEMERIIAERFGRPLSKKAETLIKKREKRSNLSESDDEEERRKKRKHRLRRRHRKSDDDLDSDRPRRHKRRRRRAKETDSDSNSSRESDRQRSRRWRQHKDRRSVLSSGSESTGSSSDDDERRERRRKKRSRGHRREGV